MNYPHRYDRNLILSSEAQLELGHKRVAVIGLGGLGGFAAEELARLGVGHILGFDFDVFDETNLNRQLFSSEQNLGLLKTDEAAKRISMINSDILFEGINGRLNEQELEAHLCGCDAVLDCLDSLKDRLILEKICERLSIPMVHAAIDGWFGQVSTVFPGDNTLEKIFSTTAESDTRNGNTVFTASAVASLQVSETLKLLSGMGTTLRNKMISIDLLNNEFEIIRL